MLATHLTAGLWVLIILVGALELGLLVYALAVWARTRDFNGSKWLWLALIVVFEIAGPVVFLIAGRAEPQVDVHRGPDTPPGNTLDDLYGPRS